MGERLHIPNKHRGNPERKPKVLQRVARQNAFATGRAANGSVGSIGIFYDCIAMRKDQTVALDVLVGERPGGRFRAFLLYEKEGETYPADEEGQPRFPVFQLAPAPIPFRSAKTATPFSVSTSTWTGRQ